MKTDANILPLDEFRAIWVYGLNVPDAEWGALLAEGVDPETGEIDRPLRDALGLEALDSDFIDFLINDELEAFNLSRLLVEAHGMDPQSIAPDAAKLDALRGQVLLVHSNALGSLPPSVEPKPPLKFIGRYSETLKMTSTPMAPAQGGTTEDEPISPTKKVPSDAAMGGRVATVALLVMALLVWLMIWIAG